MRALPPPARARRTRRARPTGRPTAGVRKGERVKDYPQTSLRLPPETKAKLYALSRVAGTPQWRLVSEAVECLFRGRTRAEQRQVLRYLSVKRVR
jgi:hypothetical protein